MKNEHLSRLRCRTSARSTRTGATWNAVRIAAGRHSGASGSIRTTRAVRHGMDAGPVRRIANVSASSSTVTARCPTSIAYLPNVCGTRNGNGRRISLRREQRGAAARTRSRPRAAQRQVVGNHSASNFPPTPGESLELLFQTSCGGRWCVGALGGPERCPPPLETHPGLDGQGGGGDTGGPWPTQIAAPRLLRGKVPCGSVPPPHPERSGVSELRAAEKWPELAKEVLPGLTRVGYLVNPTNASSVGALNDARRSAYSLEPL